MKTFVCVADHNFTATKRPRECPECGSKVRGEVIRGSGGGGDSREPLRG